VNHIDTAESYNDSELRIGPWMDDHREAFFLATKTGDRTRQGAWDHLQTSLERLHTDHVDLWQLHNLTDPDQWETAMGPGGALEAAIEAKEQGLARFLAVTGHGFTAPAMHKRSLEHYDFDSVLLPMSFPMLQNAQYAADFEALLALCEERNVAVRAIKVFARRPRFTPRVKGLPWYDAFEEQEDIDRAMHWALGHPGTFVITPSSTVLLPKVLDAGDRFEEALPDEQMAEAAERLEMAPVFAGMQRIVY
jgi:aryl-alcohol dehydrogenase-like predicted oxidoreductase